MIFDFKKSKLVYMLLVVLSMIVVAVLFGGVSPGGGSSTASFGIYVESKTLRVVYSFLAVVPLIILSAYYADKVAKKEHEKLLRILDMDCNPKQFLNSYVVIAGRTGRYQNTMLQKKVMLALGYMEAGNIEKAISVLSKIQFRKDTKKERKLSVLGYDILCHCYLRLEDTENGAKFFKLYVEAVTALKDDNLDDYHREQLEQNVLGHYLDFLLGNPGDAVSVLEKAMVEYPTNRQQINAALMAALVCIKQGDMEKARELLSFVADKGKDLWAKGRAQEALGDMAKYNS
ncbi:MAG: hypothetical protein ACYCX2_06820 [Christensenellales bacterium]